MAIYVITSINLNYLPKARVLFKSLRKFHKDWKNCLVISEDRTELLDQKIRDFEEVDDVLWMDQLQLTDGFGGVHDQDSRKQWIFKHNVVEICTAVKGQALVEIMQRNDCEGVFYFDPDIIILDKLDLLVDQMKNAGSILLTPHITQPQTNEDTVLDNEFGPLKWGVFNLGFLGVRNDANGNAFAKWWRDRLMYHCYDDIPNGVFTDQSWCDLAPAIFAGVKVVREPEFNVATWNLSERHVTGDDLDSMMVNKDRRLAFFHFSGIDKGAQLIMLNKYGSNMPVLYKLRECYLEQCRECEVDEFKTSDWKYSKFDNGKLINTRMRELYRNRKDLQNAFRNPFETGPNSYFQWYHAEKKRLYLTELEYMNKSRFMQIIYKYYRKLRKRP
jgi:AraC-like DNA-binding protein